MAEVQLIKREGSLHPANQQDADALAKIKTGAVVHAEIVQPRNGRFHRKFMAMLGFVYEYWTPPEADWKGIPAAKNFEVFRKEVVIRAGFYSVSIDLKGNTKLVADSISFASMDETRFAEVYTAVFNVCWSLVLSKVPNMTEEQAHNVINSMMEFD